jgi:tetratricopeptide (TPR) repeat protein/transcriptional regulator with XRE-family HTH domain
VRGGHVWTTGPRAAAVQGGGDFPTFGQALKYLRRRARLTQRELGLAVGYSEAQICRLEQNRRLPDPITLAALFVPALGLERDQALAARLLELAAEARGEVRPAAPGAQAPAVGHARAAQQAPAEPAEVPELDAIPAPPRDAVPRTGILTELRERLASDRAVVVLGLPGMGKTTLAAALAREHGPEPVCWLTLSAGLTTSADALLSRLGRALGVEEPSPPPPLETRLERFGAALLARPLLVCLDGAQLIRDDQAVLRTLGHLVEATPARLLLTSREQLPLPGLSTLRLGGLEPPEARTLVARLGGPLPAELAERLVARTGGSPMLLRLSLAQLRTAPNPARLIEHLETQPEVAAYLLDTTLRHLGESAGMLLALVAVFRQPVDLHDETLVDLYQASEGPRDLLEDLGELQRYQLIDHPAQAQLHPLVRDHVYARLVGDVARRRRLHRVAATWYELVREDALEAAWHFSQAGEVAQASEVLAGQVRALVRAGRALTAADLAGTLLRRARRAGAGSDLVRQLLQTRGDLLVNTVRAAEAEAAYRQALALGASPALHAQVAWRLAESLLQRAQVSEALALCREAAAALAPSDILLLAQLAATECRAHLMLSAYDDAVDRGELALELAALLGAVAPQSAAQVRARALAVLGIVARLHRRYGAALDHLRRAIAAAREADLQEIANRCLFNIGALRFEQGQMGAALEVYAEALADMRAVGDSYGVARVLHALSQVQRNRGDLEATLALLDEARAIKRRLGDAQGLAQSENSQAVALLALGRVAEARALSERTLVETAEIGEQWARSHFLDTLAMVELVGGDRGRARALLREALALPGLTDPRIRALISTHLALAELVDGSTELAGTLLREEVPADHGPEVALDRQFLAAAVALARGDAAAVRDAASAMADQVSGSGFALYAPVAARLEAAASDPPPLAALPRLLWVIRADALG